MATTIPGGRYMTEAGVYVDAHGAAVKAPAKAEPKADTAKPKA